MRKFKIIFDEPTVVGMGPSYAEVGWGPWQFPRLDRSSDGRIFASCHAGEDSAADYGKEPYWFMSSDNGKHWQKISRTEAAQGYTECANGDKIRTIECAPIDVPANAFENAELLYTIVDCGAEWKVYRFDDIKPGYFSKKWKIFRLKAGCTEPVIEESDIIGWNNMPLTVSPNGPLPPFAFGRIRKAPDGSLWLTHYCDGIDPETAEGTGGLAQYFFHSNDNGKTWEFASWLDPRKTEGAGVFCEGDITWTVNGTAVAIVRGAKSFYATSSDGGYTWNPPKEFEWRYAQPSVLSLGCGVTLGLVGRPGIALKASSDPNCDEWTETIDFIGENDKGGCCYTDIVPLSDTEALIIYTVFEYPDGNGKERKTLLTRKITIEFE